MAKTRSTGMKKTSKAARAPKPKSAPKADPKRKDAASKPAKKSSAPAPTAKKPAAKTAKKDTKAPAAPAKPKPPEAKAAPAKPAPPAPAAAGGAKKPAPAAAPAPGAKNTSVVQNRPMRRSKPEKKLLEMPFSEPLLKPGGPKWKPLIPSGPKAAPTGGAGDQLPDGAALPKSKFTKKELERYRQILLQKRAELVGDVAHMEDEALRQNSGALSSLPQHMAEQGSETYDQTLSLDLAAVDRNLIREIDDALRRIEEGTYGVCLRTGRLISQDRLNELPWTKYSIEAAREIERRPYAE